MIGDTLYQCTCGSRDFFEMVQVRKYAGGGMGKTAHGFKCAECGRRMSGDVFSKMEEIRILKERQAQDAQRLAQLEDYGDDGTEEAGMAQGKAKKAERAAPE